MFSTLSLSIRAKLQAMFYHFMDSLNKYIQPRHPACLVRLFFLVDADFELKVRQLSDNIFPRNHAQFHNAYYTTNSSDL